jgi:flavodoxin
MPILNEYRDCLIVCTSVHHGNTRKIAGVMAAAVGGSLFVPGDEARVAAQEGAMLGLGSGIYFGAHHRSLLAFAESLQPMGAGTVFLFSTSGTGDWLPRAIGVDYHRKLRCIMQRKGFTVVGEFTCRGLDTFGLWGMWGGIARGHPNDADVERARAFAAALIRTERVELRPE